MRAPVVLAHGTLEIMSKSDLSTLEMDRLTRPKKGPSDTIPDIDPDALRSDLMITLRRWWLVAQERAPLWARRFRDPKKLLKQAQADLQNNPRHKWIALSAALAAAALSIVAIAAAVSDDGPAAPIVASNEIDDARLMVDRGEAAKAVEILERRLKTADAAEEPAIHAALGYAYAHERARLRALPHYARAIERAPAVIRDQDLKLLVMMLVMQRPRSTEVEQIIGKIGPRALPALNEMAEDDTRDATLRRRARDLHQTISSQAAPST